MKVTMGESPTEQLIAKASEEFTATDSNGRVYTLKKPGFLAHFAIVETVGPVLSPNEVYMRMVNPLIYLVAIDGDPIPPPTKKIQIDALITRIGEEGYLAIMKKINEHFEVKDPEDLKAAIKK